MKFTCETKDFLNAVILAKQFIRKNSFSIISSIISCICLELYDNKLNVRFTDLKNSGEYFFNVKNGENGTILLRMEKIDSVLRKIKDTIINCYIDKNCFCISNKSKTILFKIKILEDGIEKFPALPEIKEDLFINMKKIELSYLLNKTIFMLSNENDNNYFNKGLFCELEKNKIIMSSTDGRRLSNIFINKKIEKEKQIVISFDILNILKDYLTGEDNISLFIDDKFICVKFDNIILYSALLSVGFLDYKKVIIEKTDKQIIINRLKLKNAIECVCLMSDETYSLKLNISKNKLILKSDNSILGEAKNIIDCEYEGENEVINLNYKFLYDLLSVMDKEKVCIGFNYADKPILIKEVGNDSFLNIICPMAKDKNEK